MSNTTTLDLAADVIDVRDIIARFEELEAAVYDVPMADAIEELETLRNILAELAGDGGDEQWRGDWYPVTLVCDSYLVDYLLDDCGEIPTNLAPYIEIDWEATARNMRMDYSCIEIDGLTYWYR
jgi:antirestriction protein